MLQRIKTAVFLSLALLIFCDAPGVSAQSNGDIATLPMTKTKKIDELLSKYSAYGKFNGAVLVAAEGEVLFKKGYGPANMEWDISNQTDTKFRLASVTKQFTAMLTMQLVAEGKLRLDGAVTEYLPNYPTESGSKIHIHHLLSHTSGLPNYTDFGDYRELMKMSKTPSELVELFADSTLQFVPGDRFAYSNSGYALLGAIIEKVTGQALDKAMKERIFTPLKMNSTGFEKKGEILQNRATGYIKNGTKYGVASYIDMSIAYAAGGMYSTVEDLFRWDQALYTASLLSKEYMDLIFNKHIPAWGKDYGYGWLIGEMSIGNTEDRVQVIEHDGVVNGFRSLVMRFPADHSSIILLDNAGGAPVYDIAKAVAAILYDKTYDMPKQSVAHGLLKKIESGGIEKARRYFHEVKENEEYYLDENEMNMISYELMQSDKTQVGLEVLQLAMNSFPSSFNLYDSYAELSNKLGKREQAINYYKKSLVLNPKNENGIRMLEGLGVQVDSKDFFLLRPDDTWGAEIFVLPLHFAKELPYHGTEEAHFPKGWRKPDSPEFWSYVFAWNIDLNEQLTAQKVALDLQMYFDGLTSLVNKNREFTLPKSVAAMRQFRTEGAVTEFSGTIDIFDTFVTNMPMKLYVKAEQHFCKEQQKSVVYFRFSPKSPEHVIWKTLEDIALRDDVCGG